MLESINVRYAIALFFASIGIILMIAGAATPWYLYQPAGIEVYYYLDHLTSSLLQVTVSCQYTDSACAVGDEVKTMFDLILSCVILAILAETAIWAVLILFTFRSLQKLVKWRGKLRIPMLILAGLACVLCLCAWCLLFWFPKAFCDGYSSRGCPLADESFSGDDQGPSHGWALFIASFVISLTTFCIAIFSGSPDFEYQPVELPN